MCTIPSQGSILYAYIISSSSGPGTAAADVSIRGPGSTGFALLFILSDYWEELS
ncbi:MAG: hypothetical protein ACP5IA_04505 [Sediminispirochaetaceae bacterium]